MEELKQVNLLLTQLIYNKAISGTAIKVALCLQKNREGGGKIVKMSLSNIANSLGITVQSVLNGVKSLEENSVVTVKRGTSPLICSEYHFNY